MRNENDDIENNNMIKWWFELNNVCRCDKISFYRPCIKETNVLLLLISGFISYHILSPKKNNFSALPDAICDPNR